MLGSSSKICYLTTISIAIANYKTFWLSSFLGHEDDNMSITI